MATAKKELVEIKPLVAKRVKVRIVGDTPLIVHSWNEKSRKQIRDVKLKLKEKGKPQAKPIREAIDSIYWVKGRPTNEEIQKYDDELLKICKEGNQDIALDTMDYSGLFKEGYVIGFPASALMKASAASAYRREWTKDKVSVLTSFKIEAWDEDPELEDTLLERGFIRIKGDIPIFREDNVNVSISSADLRYRAQINNWYADIVIAYDVDGKFTLDNIVNFLNLAGFSCGIGEWRSEKSGIHGAFHVEGLDK